MSPERCVIKNPDFKRNFQMKFELFRELSAEANNLNVSTLLCCKYPNVAKGYDYE